MRAKTSSNPTHRLRDELLTRQVAIALDILRDGGVVCIPTDTLYGLAAMAMHDEAVERLFKIKRRPLNQPLPLLLSDATDMSRFASKVPDIARHLSQRFFPGALTLVLPKANGVSALVSGGLRTVAMRVPDHWVPRAIARGLGSPITGTSANLNGKTGLTTAEMVRAEIGSDVDLVIDGGPSSAGVASTVLDVSRDPPVIIRQGAVSQRQIEEACGCKVVMRISEREQPTTSMTLGEQQH